ncbi:MAG: hypothetical protein QM635_05310 [Microbacteriaceae bacterium]
MLAETIGRVIGEPVELRSVDTATHAAVLREAGADQGQVAFTTGLEANIAAGDLDRIDDSLHRLVGRPTTPLEQTLRTLDG